MSLGRRAPVLCALDSKKMWLWASFYVHRGDAITGSISCWIVQTHKFISTSIRWVFRYYSPYLPYNASVITHLSITLLWTGYCYRSSAFILGYMTGRTMFYISITVLVTSKRAYNYYRQANGCLDIQEDFMDRRQDRGRLEQRTAPIGQPIYYRSVKTIIQWPTCIHAGATAKWFLSPRQ